MQTIAELAKKWGQLNLKFESLAEIKFHPGFRVIEEYLSQKDSQCRANLTQIFSNYSKSRNKFSSTSDSAF